MLSYGPALRVVSAMLLPIGRPEAHPFRAGRLLGAPDLRGDVYHPRKQARGAVVVVHGMTPMGHRDPRLMKVNRAFARAGYRVVAPFFEDIAAFRIQEDQPERVARAALAVADDPDWCPSGRVALCSVSVTGSITLVAASRPELEGRLNAVCAIGAFGDVSAVVEELLTDPDADSFGRLILLKNLLEWEHGVSNEAALALHDAALDNWHARPQSLIDLRLLRVPEPLRHEAKRLVHDAAARRRLWESIRPKVPAILEALDVKRHAQRLKVPVTILHGMGDRVISEAQSRLLAAKLKEARVPHQLLLTPLVAHGDTRFGVRNARALPALLRLLRNFLKNAQG